MFYSQQGEDIYIYSRYINTFCSDGIFVELGGMNGVIYSNSKFFEDTLGFTGVLIEPTEQFNELVKNRPNAKCYKKAVSNKPGIVKFIGTSATAGIADSMDDKFRTIFHSNSSTYPVVADTFSNILSDANIKYIDLLSIDVEGAEKLVLDTMDWNIDVYVMVIELDGHNNIKDEGCRQILKSKGFIYDTRININEFWINPNYKNKDRLFDTTKIFNKNFNNINEVGQLYCVEPHVIPEIIRELKK